MRIEFGVSRGSLKYKSKIVNLGYFLEILSNPIMKERLIEKEKEITAIKKIISDLINATNINSNFYFDFIKQKQGYLKYFCFSNLELEKEDIEKIISKLENIKNKLEECFYEEVAKGNYNDFRLNYEKCLFPLFSKTDYIEKENYDLACLLSMFSKNYDLFENEFDKLKEKFSFYQSNEHLFDDKFKMSHFFTHFLERKPLNNELDILSFISFLEHLNETDPKILLETVSNFGEKGINFESLNIIVEHVFHVVNEKISILFYLFEILSKFKKNLNRTLCYLAIAVKLNFLKVDDFQDLKIKALIQKVYKENDLKLQKWFDYKGWDSSYHPKDTKPYLMNPESWLDHISVDLRCNEKLNRKEKQNFDEVVIEILWKKLKEKRRELLLELEPISPLFLKADIIV